MTSDRQVRQRHSYLTQPEVSGTKGETLTVQKLSDRYQSDAQEKIAEIRATPITRPQYDWNADRGYRDAQNQIATHSRVPLPTLPNLRSRCW